MYNVINKESGIYPDCKDMDIWLTSLGFNEKSIKYLYEPCELHDPYLMNDIQKASDMIFEGIKNEETFAIVGDYDADGVTASTEMYLTLKHLKADVFVIVPHRIKDGYGLSNKIVDKAIEEGATFIITVDNGIASIDAIDYAKSKGLKVIVTDHHELQAKLPNADAIVHPALGEYPFKNISGAQVAYKLACVLFDNKPQKKLKSGRTKRVETELKEYLFQLSTISIVSDVMPIASPDENLAKVNENRKWLQDGLNSIRKKPNWHIENLLKALKIAPKNVDEQTIGFYIAPTINSAGRLNDAMQAIDFLTEVDETESLMKMSFIMFLNDERKKVKNKTMEKIALNDDDKAHIVAVEDIHEGIIGIIAGQIANNTKKPTFVFTNCEVEGEKAWKGSARGNGAINLFENLEKLQTDKHCLYAFGGHADAAGLTILDKDFKTFKDGFLSQIDGIDTEVSYDILEVNSYFQKIELSKAVKALKPFGNGMPLPKFKQKLSIKDIDLYYKSGHAKLTCWEKNEDDKFVSSTFWMFNELENIKHDSSFMDNVIFVKSNVSQLIERGLDADEAEKTKCETYSRKKDSTLRRNFIVELGYTSFGGAMAPNFNLVYLYE